MKAVVAARGEHPRSHSRTVMATLRSRPIDSAMTVNSIPAISRDRGKVLHNPRIAGGSRHSHSSSINNNRTKASSHPAEIKSRDSSPGAQRWLRSRATNPNPDPHNTLRKHQSPDPIRGMHACTQEKPSRNSPRNIPLHLTLSHHLSRTANKSRRPPTCQCHRQSVSLDGLRPRQAGRRRPLNPAEEQSAIPPK